MREDPCGSQASLLFKLPLYILEGLPGLATTGGTQSSFLGHKGSIPHLVTSGCAAVCIPCPP